MARTRQNRRRRRRNNTPWYARPKLHRSYGRNLLAAAPYALAAYNWLGNVEKKTHDISNAGTISSTGAVYSLCDIAQGDDYNQRNGRSVKFISIESKETYTINAAATTTFVRKIIFADNDLQDSGTLAAVTDVLKTAAVNSMRNPDPIKMKRFKIYSDKVYSLDSSASSASLYKKSYSKLQHHLKYSGVTAADAGQGCLCMLLISDQVTNVPSLDIAHRLRYVDN